MRPSPVVYRKEKKTDKLKNCEYKYCKVPFSSDYNYYQDAWGGIWCTVCGTWQGRYDKKEQGVNILKGRQDRSHFMRN